MTSSASLCPVHGSVDLQPHVAGALDQMFDVDETPFSYSSCPECGSLVLSPRPGPTEIGRYYEPYYTQATLQALRERAESGRRVGAAGRLRAMGFVKRFADLGGQLSPETQLLDVGCGLGSFAGNLQRMAGLKARGVDFSKDCVDFCKDVHDLEVDEGELTAQSYEDGRFDVVTAWHYMEHVYDPQAELQEMARITKPGGWLMVETPTPGTLARLFGRRWLYLMPPTHLYHYPPEALATLIERAGYEVKKIYRPWFPGELAGSVLFSFGFHGLMPRVFEGGRPFSQRLLTYFFLAQMVYDIPITGLLAKLGRSGLLRIFARKKD